MSSRDEILMEKKPSWNEIYTQELNLENLFQKLIQTEHRMKDYILEHENKIKELEERLSVLEYCVDTRAYYE